MTKNTVHHMGIERIISGAQTGADRAGLDAAIRYGIPHGGWCPKGRTAEDGIIPAKYCLMETPGTGSIQRTEWNVRDSDGTVIFTLRSELMGGSLHTQEFARGYNKPFLHLSCSIASHPALSLSAFLRNHHIKVLNVAGSRESEEPDIYVATLKILEDLVCLRSSI